MERKFLWFCLGAYAAVDTADRTAANRTATTAATTTAGDNTAATAADRTVVVMLFDGFAPAYIERFPTPAFDRMRERGAYTHRMEPAFPTISLINGVTISTGCWPENHGIVTNLFR